MAVTAAEVDRVTTSSTASVTLAAQNRNRRGLTIHNEAAVTLYVKAGLGASSTDYSVPVLSGDTLNLRGNPIYTGVVSGRLASGVDAAAQVTEFYG